MKILLVVHDFLPKHLAGVELYTYNIGRALMDRGHELSIYTREFGHFDQEFAEEDTEYDGLNVKTVYFNYKGNNKLKLLRKWRLNYHVHFLEQHFDQSLDELLMIFFHDFYNPTLDKHFNNWLDQIKPDIIHIQHLKGLSASFLNVARKRKIPIVITLHDFWFMCSTTQLLTTSYKRCSGPLYGLKCPTCIIPTLKPVIARCLHPFLSVPYLIRTLYLRHLLNKLDLIIAPSKFLKNKFIAHGISKKKIIFSDYGMHTNLLQHNNRNSNCTLRFAFVGSIMRHKGVHVLIEAFNRLSGKKAELVIYGDPGYAPNYYKRVGLMATNPKIKFMGPFDNHRVYEKLAEIDVLVVPSIWYENSPLTIHEAALAGVPVITSNIGGMAELIKKMKNGLLFQVEDVNDLYEKMNLLIENPRLIQQLTCKAKQIKTIEENASELEKYYAKLLSRKKPSETKR